MRGRAAGMKDGMAKRAANKEKGEFALVVGDQRYVLRVTTNAACELEDVHGRTLDQVQVGLLRGSLKDLRLLLWAGLREHHPEIATDDKDSVKAIGALVDAAGGVNGVWTQMKAFMALNADPGADDAETPERPAPRRPRRAQAGTGGDSTSTRSPSA